MVRCKDLIWSKGWQQGWTDFCWWVKFLYELNIYSIDNADEENSTSAQPKSIDICCKLVGYHIKIIGFYHKILIQ
jgi:hypothetical protein